MLEFLSSPTLEIFDNVLDVVGPILGGGALFLVQQTIKHKEDNQKSANEIKGEIYYYTRMARINIITEMRKVKINSLQVDEHTKIYQAIRDYQELIETTYILPFVKVCVKYNTLKNTVKFTNILWKSLNIKIILISYYVRKKIVSKRLNKNL